MDFTRFLSALVLCASVAGCATNPNPESFAAVGPSWNMTAGPSAADWSYDPNRGGYSDDLFLRQLWQHGSGAEKAFGMAPDSPLNPGGPNSGVEQVVQSTNGGAR